MYNYDTTNTVDSLGKFVDPENRWGGIMRGLTTNDFELTNIEFIQFWVLDPFNEDAEGVDTLADHNGGDLYFNLGNISEDVLPDSEVCLIYRAKFVTSFLPRFSDQKIHCTVLPGRRKTHSQ